MKNMFVEISERLENGENIVVGQTIRRTGSTPREIGSKCIILEDGTTLGTIGGGLLECRVVEKAKELFKGGRGPPFVTLAHNLNHLPETVFLQRFTPLMASSTQ